VFIFKYSFDNGKSSENEIKLVFKELEIYV